MIHAIFDIINTDSLKFVEKFAIVEQCFKPTSAQVAVSLEYIEVGTKEAAATREQEWLSRAAPNACLLVRDGSQFSLITNTVSIPKLNCMFSLEKTDPILQNLKALLTKILQHKKPRIHRNITELINALRQDRVVPIISAKEIIATQLERFILIQGLAMVDSLALLLKPEFASEPDVFKAAYSEVLSNSFGLSKEQLQYYDHTFGKCHNQTGLLTYRVRLRDLAAKEAEQFCLYTEQYVHAVCSPNAENYYRLRYDMTNNPHLQQVFRDKKLANKWQRGATQNLAEFIVTHKISAQQKPLDIASFLQHQIVEHNHLNKIDFADMHAYLTGTKLQRQQIEKDLTIKLQTVPADTRQHDFLKIQLNIIALLNYASQKSLQFQQALALIIRLGRNYVESAEFAHSLRMIYIRFFKKHKVLNQ